MKYNKHYTINLDEETAQKVETIARLTQRKASDLLRLLLVPIIESELLRVIDQGNETKPAKWTPDPLDKLPKL